jgi:hypothetical protein
VFVSPRSLVANPLALVVALAAALLAVAPLAAPAALAQDRNPADIATTMDEAGKDILSFVEEEGSDDYGRWVQRRWERDRDNEDARVGPVLTFNKVWVAKDVPAAEALFKEQAGKLREFPEAVDPARGPFAWDIQPLGDQTAALSACVDCNDKGGLELHHRVVVRKGNVVGVMYIFGDEKVATQDLMLFFAGKLAERM